MTPQTPPQAFTQWITAFESLPPHTYALSDYVTLREQLFQLFTTAHMDQSPGKWIALWPVDNKIRKRFQIVEQLFPLPLSNPGEWPTALPAPHHPLNSMERWLDPREGFLTAEPGAFTSTDRLYEVYQHWYTETTGEDYAYAMPRNSFGKHLTSTFRSPHKHRQGQGRQHGYNGVTINAQWDHPFSDEHP